MLWQRIILGLAIIAMSITMLVPLPLWVAASLMLLSLIAAIVVVAQLVRHRR